MLAPSVATYWSVYEQPRNREGFPLYLGHGVLIRKELLEDLGGFSERTTSEDIDFTYRLAIWPGRRCRGRVSEDIFAVEEVPSSLRRYKLRFGRWTRQDLRLAPTAIAYLWRGRHRLSPLEAFDLLVKQLHFPVWGLGQAYLFLFGLLLLVRAHDKEHSPWTLAFVSLLASIGAALPVLLVGDSTFRHRARAALGSLWLFNSLTLVGTSSVASLLRPSAGREFVPTGMRTSIEGDRAQREQYAAALALTVLAALSNCVLLAAISLAALGADLKPGAVRTVVNAGALAAVVAGFAQLMSNPEYSMALLPLAASRY